MIARLHVSLIVALIVFCVLLLSLGRLEYQGTFSPRLLPTSWVPATILYLPPHNEAEKRSLNTAECMARYPDLYKEADRAQQWYQSRGGITEAMVDDAEKSDASARLTIYDNKLFVKAFYGGVNTRTQAAIAAVYATLLTSPEPMPDVDFVIQTSDAGGGDYPHFVLDRKETQRGLWLMPDFGFYSWPEPGVGAYSQVRAEALAYETERLGLRLNGTDATLSSWSNKIQKLMWRGVPMVEVRRDLLRASDGQPWSDVRELNWGAVNQDEAGREANNGDLKTPAEHCQYAFLAHVEGWAYSGRLKYLQQCRSVVVTHPLEYIQHYHHLFNGVDGDPDQNMVIVPLPLEDNLPGVMEDLLSEDSVEKVERIAANSWKFLREGYISPAANECYYRYALRAYAEVQRFRPSIEERGTPYESFLLMGRTHWDPHR